MSLVPNSHHDDAAQALLQISRSKPSHLECRAASEVLARVILQRNGSVVPSSSLKQKKKQRSLLLTSSSSSSSSSRNQFQLEFCPANASTAFLPPEALYGSSDPSSLSRRAISGGEFTICVMSFVCVHIYYAPLIHSFKPSVGSVPLLKKQRRGKKASSSRGGKYVILSSFVCVHIMCLYFTHDI